MSRSFVGLKCIVKARSLRRGEKERGSATPVAFPAVPRNAPRLRTWVNRLPHGRLPGLDVGVVRKDGGGDGRDGVKRASSFVDSRLIGWHGEPIGEVRIKVRLKNAGDEAVMHRKKLAKSKVLSIEVDAVVDTGAVRSCIPETIMRKLGLMEQGRQGARSADGRTDTVMISEPATLYLLDREVTENFLALGDEVLIGQTALEATDLLVDSAGQQVTTNPDHPIAPVIRIR